MIEPIKNQPILTPSDYLFRHEDLDDGMVKNWFDVYEKFENEINLYQTLFYSKRLFIETRFLNIATALESFHSKFFNNQIIYQKRILELLENKNILFRKVIKDFDDFSKIVKDSRNKFVHHEVKQDSIERSKLIWAIYILRFLFEAYLLEIIGFSDEKIEKIYEKRMEKYLKFGSKF